MKLISITTNKINVCQHEKSHILIFKDGRGHKRKIALIKDCNDSGQPKSDQSILDEATLLIRAFCAERSFTIYYTRIWNRDGTTIFDVGSHSEFFHLIPAVDFTHYNKEEVTDGNACSAQPGSCDSRD